MPIPRRAEIAQLVAICDETRASCTGLKRACPCPFRTARPEHAGVRFASPFEYGAIMAGPPTIWTRF
jgi:hypothetical protein